MSVEQIGSGFRYARSSSDGKWAAGLEARIASRSGLIAALLVVLSVLTLSAIADRAAGFPASTIRGWNLLGVKPAMFPSFADLRNVTHRWACARAHVDSYTNGMCDPWGRLFNYPPIWLLPASLGWDKAMTIPVGFAECALLFVDLWILLPARTLKGQLLAMLLALSTPVMFAAERGNVDILMLTAIAVSFRATRDLPQRTRDIIRFGVIGTLAWLKLFPIAAMAYAAAGRSRAIIAGIWLLALGAAIVAIYGPLLAVLESNTGHHLEQNYGRLALWVWRVSEAPLTAAAARTSLLAALGVGGLAVGAGAAFAAMRAPRTSASHASLLDGSYESDLAAAGVAIFLFTFLIGLNYDYRLIFLLLLHPLLRRGEGRLWGAVGMVIAVRLLLAHRAPDVWLDVSDWGLFAVGAAWLSASAWWALAPTMLVRRTFGSTQNSA